MSVEWFKQQYAKRKCIPVQLHPNNKATEPAMAKNTFALTFNKLSQLVGEVRALLKKLCSATTTKEARLHLCSDLLREHGLGPKQLVDKFLVPFEIV